MNKRHLAVITAAALAMTAGGIAAAAAPNSRWPDASKASKFIPIAAFRLWDSRLADGALKPGQTQKLMVDRGDVPSTGVTAIVVNVTAIKPTQDGYLTVWADKAPRPNVSSINVTQGRTVSNEVTIAVPSDMAIQVFNHAGRSNVLLDVVGYYSNEVG